MLPCTHGGHSVIDAHGKKHCGLLPERFEADWLTKACPHCSARKWCYNIEKPTDDNEIIESLETIYRCYIEIAIQQGIQPFGLTAHLPVPGEFAKKMIQRYGVSSFQETNLCMLERNLLLFVEAARRVRNYYGPKKVLIATEVDFLPLQFSNQDILQTLLKEMPNIVIIGSVHFVEIDGEIFRLGRQGKDKEQAEAYIARNGVTVFWKKIFESYLDLIEQCEIDILGHLFAFQKHLPACPDNPEIRQFIERIIDAVANKKILVDINTSGFTKGIHRDNPYFPENWVRMFRDRGARFTIGDDSHSQSQIGQALAQCQTFLSVQGVDTVHIPQISIVNKKRIRTSTPFKLS